MNFQIWRAMTNLSAAMGLPLICLDHKHYRAQRLSLDVQNA